MRELTQEARHTAIDLLSSLDHYGLIQRPGERAQRDLVRRFAAQAVQPIIDEREELVTALAEREEGWRRRVSRFLRRLGRLLEES